MIWDVRVSPNARRDRDRAIAWLDENRPWVTDSFIDDYFRTLRRVEEDADRPAIDDRGFRRLAFDTFQYHVWCRIIEDSNVVYIVLVSFQGRDPEEIEQRLRTS